MSCYNGYERVGSIRTSSNFIHKFEIILSALLALVLLKNVISLNFGRSNTAFIQAWLAAYPNMKYNPPSSVQSVL